MDKNTPITPNECVWLEGHHYPFYFKRVNENGKPVLWGDFSWGFFPAPDCLIESEVEWKDVIYPIPKNL